MSNIKFIQGNCLDKIKELPDNYIDCIISSPPYFGLRDYGMKEQFGLESNYKDYINNTIKVFETFKSKLKDEATIWWNVGDSYHNFRPTNNKQKLYKHPAYPKQSISGNRRDLPIESLKRNQRYNDIKEKDLMMIPNRVAIALQENGWYIRSEIIWVKPNHMPESVKDRPTCCHEKIWLITKNKKYYYDCDIIKEPLSESSVKRYESSWKGNGKRDYPFSQKNNLDKYFGSDKAKEDALKGKNKRNVWTITTKPCREAHFATFPIDLIEPCVLAGCKEGGTILDPFSGAGTTGIAAKKHNRNAILIELNPKYIEIAKKRIQKIFGELI